MQESDHKRVSQWSGRGGSPERIQGGIYYSLLKRAVDICVGLAALLASMPFMAVAGLAICLGSSGGPLFKQKRVGKDGKPFGLYKLRTMYVGADSEGFVTGDRDPRVTRIGGFLRDRKIDELPQLFNVIRGEMSLIGPRPLSLEETRYLIETLGFTQTDPGLCPRVKPGLTGLEQIYRIHHLSYAERFNWNSSYESNLSFRTDLRIFLTTIFQHPVVCAITACIGIFELMALVHFL